MSERGDEIVSVQESDVQSERPTIHIDVQRLAPLHELETLARTVASGKLQQVLLLTSRMRDGFLLWKKLYWRYQREAPTSGTNVAMIDLSANGQNQPKAGWRLLRKLR